MSARLTEELHANPVGLYGKMPKYGDFVQRHVASHFVSGWDSWLQDVLSGSQESLGNAWLAHWLEAPIWRFALSAGVLGKDDGWIGVLVPSVDSVGRYFPLTLVMPLVPHMQAVDAFFHQGAWFAQLEDVAISALDPQCDLNSVLADLKQLPVMANLGPSSIERVADPFLISCGDSTLPMNKEANSFVALEIQTRISIGERSGPYCLWGASDDAQLGWVAHYQQLPDIKEFCTILTNQHPEVIYQ